MPIPNLQRVHWQQTVLLGRALVAFSLYLGRTVSFTLMKLKLMELD